MAEKEGLTEFVIPLDMSTTEEWAPSLDYKLGEHTFEYVECQRPEGPKNKLIAVHKIVKGPAEDMGRTFNVFFSLDNQKAWGLLKFYMLRLWGEQAFVRGQPAFTKTMVGTQFTAMIVSKPYKRDNIMTIQYVMDMNTIKVTGKNAAVAASQAAAAAVP